VDSKVVDNKVVYSKDIGNKKVDSKVVDNKVVYSKDIGNKKVGSEKMGGFLVDFTLLLLLLSIKFYKKRFSIYFLKLY